MREPIPSLREAEALAEMAKTELRRPAALALLGCAALLLASWWALEGLALWRGSSQLIEPLRGLESPWASSSSEGPAASAPWREGRQLAEALERFETAFDRQSSFSRAMRPPMQELLTRVLAAGSEQAAVGRGGWLFFRADVDHLLAPGFLEPRRRPAIVTETVLAEAKRTSDPLPAVLDLHRFLAARGVALVVLPVPGKPAIHPERLAPGARRPVANRSQVEFARAMAAAGVELFDPTDLLARGAAKGESQYLATDSHWRPEAVERVAAALAERLRPRLVGTASVRFERGQPTPIAALGDTVALLGLASTQRLFAREAVTTRPVHDSRSGDAIDLSTGGEVLLLGDSFTNVFSDPALGWGTGAGLAEQLAHELQAPVARIAVNAGGAANARRALARALASGQVRLAGVRAVVWQFAMRELSQGDWVRIDWERLEADPGAPSPPPGGGALRAVGRVLRLAPLPVPGATPYREALAALELERADGSRLLVYRWAWREGRPSESAGIALGATFAARLLPWSEVEAQLGTVQRFELPGDGGFDLPAYFAEEIER